MLKLLKRYAPGQAVVILLSSAAGGLLAASLIAVVNTSTAAGDKPSTLWLGLAFVLVVAVMYSSQRLAARRLVSTFEEVHRGLRETLSERLSRAPLPLVESLDGGITRATRELEHLASTLEAWVTGVQHLMFLLSITVAVALISLKALLIWSLAFAVVAWRVRGRARAMRTAQRLISGATGRLAGRFDQLLDSNAQIKLDGELADAMVNDVLAGTDELYERQGELEEVAASLFVVALVTVYALGWLPAVFADPRSAGLDPEAGYELVTLIALSIGPLLGLSMTAPDWLRAEAAAEGIREVLDALDSETAPAAPGPEVDSFETISLSAAEFVYEGAHGGFHVGPLDLRVQRGELLFITGGNGSGKTTLLKMLLGLYPLTGGELALDSRRVEKSRERYAGLFTAILGQQHLFSRLYCLDLDVAEERATALLDRFGLRGVVHYQRGSFGELDLSTGQRMRLAMVVALLEDRPVCVFDQWTANQDPDTTRLYYDVLLPELRAAGKTVIAVSHDERFFDRADRVIRLVDGRIVAPRPKPGTRRR